MPATFLQEVSVFAALTEPQLAQLEAAFEERRLAGNREVFRKGDPGDSLWVVGRGGVAIVQDAVGEPIERIRDLGPAEVFGELEVLDGSPRLYTARTLAPSVLFRLAASRLRRFLEEVPQLEMKLRTLAIQRRTARLRAVLAPSTRREPRIRVDRAVRLVLSDGQRVEARIEDLSSGGACLSGAPPGWQAGQEVSFSLALPGQAPLLEAAGTVRWRAGVLVGIAFADSGPAHRRRVEQALRELLARG